MHTVLLPKLKLQFWTITNFPINSYCYHPPSLFCVIAASDDEIKHRSASYQNTAFPRMPVSQFCLLSGALKFQLYVALSLSAHKLLFTISHRHSRVRQLNCHAIIFTAVARLGRRVYFGHNLTQDFTFALSLQEFYYMIYSCLLIYSLTVSYTHLTLPTICSV